MRKKTATTLNYKYSNAQTLIAVCQTFGKIDLISDTAFVFCAIEKL